MSVNLSYSFETGISDPAFDSQLQLENPLFKMLSAIGEAGSIGRAAEQLGLSYRYVWGFLKKQEAAFGRELLSCNPGQAARLSEFGERLVWTERRMLARFLPAAEALAAKLDRELLLAVQPELQSLPVSASHDLLFGALRDSVRAHAPVLLDVEYVGSAKALERLNEGSCALAGMHLPLDAPHLCQRGSGVHNRIGRLLRLGEHKLIRLATREQGLIVGRGNPLGLQTIADLQRQGVQFVNRQAGSGTRILFDELLSFHQVRGIAIQGYRSEEPTHLSVAATVAAGMAHCGFGLRAAAARFHLDFVPLLVEQYFIVCRKPMLDSPAAQAIIDALRSDDFRRQAAALPGYSAADSGQIISLRRMLPWYK